jgi:hypothetical protein
MRSAIQTQFPRPEVYFTQPVNYQWSTPDGTIHRSHTVIVASRKRDLSRSRKAFFRVNKHVQEVE